MARGQVVTNAHSGLGGTVEGRPMILLSQTFISIYIIYINIFIYLNNIPLYAHIVHIYTYIYQYYIFMYMCACMPRSFARVYSYSNHAYIFQSQGTRLAFDPTPWFSHNMTLYPCSAIGSNVRNGGFYLRLAMVPMCCVTADVASKEVDTTRLEVCHPWFASVCH